MPRNYNSSTATDNGFLSGNGLFNWIDDAASWLLFGNPDMSTSVWNDLTGVTSQQREFEQQEYLMDKQNEYNDPSNQVARLVRAGVNVNSASAQIAQNNVSANPSAVATNTNGTANAVGQVASAVGGLSKLGSEIKLNEANAGKSVAETITEDVLREDRKNELKSIFNLNDSQAGLFELQSRYFIPDVSARINLSNAQAEMFRQQVDVYKEQINKYKAEIKLLDKQANTEEWLAKQAEFNSYQSKWYYDTMNSFGFDPRNPFETNMFGLAVKYGPDSLQYQRGIKWLQDSLTQQRNSDAGLFKYEQGILFDNAMKQLEDYMRKELGNKYKGLPADLINSFGKGFGIGLGAPLGAKAAAGSPSPIGFVK